MAEEPQTRFMGGELDDLAASVARSTARVFAHNDWEWRDIGVPDEAQIAAAIRHLIASALKVPDGSSRSGRFAVEHYVEDETECLDVSLLVGSLDRDADPVEGDRVMADPVREGRPWRAEIQFTIASRGDAEEQFDKAVEAVEAVTRLSIEGGFLEQMDPADVVEGSPLAAALDKEPG